MTAVLDNTELNCSELTDANSLWEIQVGSRRFNTNTDEPATAERLFQTDAGIHDISLRIGRDPRTKECIRWLIHLGRIKIARQSWLKLTSLSIHVPFGNLHI